jgi:hypothetical protein
VSLVPRTCDYRLTVDAGMFTPLQLQPTAVGRIAFNAGTRWLREHLVSHRLLLAEYRTGLVLWSVCMRYERDLRFPDADELHVHCEVTARRGGGQLQCDVSTKENESFWTSFVWRCYAWT